MLSNSQESIIILIFNPVRTRIFPRWRGGGGQWVIFTCGKNYYYGQ